MNEEIDLILDVAEEQMKESISRLEVVLSKIRSCIKASPQMLSSIKFRLLWSFNSIITNVKYKHTRFTNNFYPTI